MTNQPLDQPSSAAPPPAWYDDPNDPAQFRYWDGAHWTAHRSPKRAAEPVVQAAAPPSPPPPQPVVQPPPQASSPVIQSAANDVPGLPRLLAVLGAVAIMIGSATTWATVSASDMSVEVNGTEGDGAFTLIGGFVIFGLLFLRRYVGGLIVGIVTGGILVSDLLNVAGLVEDSEFVDVSIGWGLYLAAAGAVVAVLAFVVLWRSERAQSKPG